MFDEVDRDGLKDAADMVVVEEESEDEAEDETKDAEEAELDGEYGVALDINTINPDDILLGPLELARLKEDAAESPDEVVDPNEVVETPDELASTTLELSDTDGCIEEVLEVLDDDKELLDCTWFAM